METNPYGVAAILQQGDPVILFVSLLLLIMSIATWTIVLIRATGLWRLRRRARVLSDFWHAQTFAEGLHMLGPNDLSNPFRYLAEEGQSALDHHRTHQDDLHGKLPLADWLSDSLRGAIDESAERLQRGVSILASVGSTAPFIGLFGTVWGIYHALVSIGVSGEASIGKVAGPVGESLIMTAFGLAVAIPAVLGFNALVRGNKGVLARLHRFAHQLHAYFLIGTPMPRQASVRSLSQTEVS